jgi:uncharacterized protein (TIGR02453 family)
MTKDFVGFRPAALTFLRQLAANNDRDWFEAHRDVYDNDLRIPLAGLVEEMDVRLATLAPEMIGDPKHSVFRIHRDVRFSKDKSPYKRHVSFWIQHRAVGRSAGSNVHGGAGLYFHLQPRESLVAAGIWMPPAPALAKIRAALTDDLRGFEHAVKKFKRRFGDLSEEAVLTRVPRGYTDDHPAAHWLRYKSFTVSRKLTNTQVLRSDLPDLLMREYAILLPFVRWLNTALGLRPAARR